MSELQSEDSGITFDEPEAQEAQTVETEQPEVNETSDLAPDSPVEGEENTPIASVDGVEVEGPEGFKKAIDKQHRKFREEQRRADELAIKLQKFEANQPVIDDVSVPPIPDSWDEDYENKIRERDAAILRKAQADSALSQRKEAEARAQQESQRQELERAQVLQSQFTENSKKLGVDHDSLMKAQDVIIEYGVTPELANALLSDTDGPLMVQHLAANPLDLYDIVQANPLQAGLLLANVKTKAAALKRKPSSAPAPAETLSGRAVPTKQRGPAGATFE